MRWSRSRSGVAALEMALLAPFLVTLMLVGIDFAAAILNTARITRALQSSAEYATLAGQNGVTWATIQTNAQSIAGSVTGAFVGPPIHTAIINQGAGAGSKCCLNNSTWNCSTNSNLTCADGSTPGVYITLTAQYPFRALFSMDTYLTGRTLSDSIVAPLQ
jgi:Flp pilus assembly protein TadG